MSGALLPAPEGLICCDASANTGGDQCTCWEPVLALQDPIRLLHEQERIQEGPPCPRRTACDDCAYRAGSPEREAVDGSIPDYTARDRFYCHDGMPLAVAYVHPSGAMHRLDLEQPVDYQPRIRGDRPFRVDGRPGLLCAGWAAVNGVRRPRSAP